MSTVLWPQYLGRYYKRYFKKLLSTAEYQKQIGSSYIIIFHEKTLEVKSSHQDTQYKYWSFEYIAETLDNFFIKLHSGTFLSFPKSQIKEMDSLKQYFLSLCETYTISYKDDLERKWK